LLPFKNSLGMLDVLKTFYRGTGDREQGFRFHIRVCYVTYDIVTDKGGDRTELLIFYAQERPSAEGYWNVEVGDKEIFGNSVVLRDGNTEILRNQMGSFRLIYSWKAVDKETSNSHSSSEDSDEGSVSPCNGGVCSGN
jgi:hypothetical protein